MLLAGVITGTIKLLIGLGIVIGVAMVIGVSSIGRGLGLVAVALFLAAR